jgi:hypothetical protein
MTRRRRPAGRKAKRPPTRPLSPRLEALEDRLAPATLTVNSTDDTVSGTTPTLDLREAILLINSGGTATDSSNISLRAAKTTQIDTSSGGFGTNDAIQFHIPTSDSGFTPATSVGITNVCLSNNVATLTTSAQVPVALGQTVIVAGLSTSLFNGIYQVTAETTATFSYVLVHPDVASTLDSGTASNSGQFSITLQAALPQILKPVVINGFSQPGSSANTMPNQGTGAGNNAIQNIILDGSQISGDGSINLGSFGTTAEADAAVAAAAASVRYGLEISGGHSTLTGLVIQHFGATYFCFVSPYFFNPGNAGGGIHLLSGGNTVAGNELTNNFNTDILIDNVPSNNFGGTTPGARNICAEVDIQGAGATANEVQGDYIGTDGTQLLSPPNGIPLSITGASNNVVGGTVIGAGNVMGRVGIFSDSSNDVASGNLVQGNYVGLNPAGTAVFPGLPGVGIQIAGIGPQPVSTSGNTIGGNTPAARNVIAGFRGVEVSLGSTSQGDAVIGNYIGTNSAGSPVPEDFGQLPDFPRGIGLGGSNSVISDNLISSMGTGVIVFFGTGNSIRGNSIYGNSGLGIVLNTTFSGDEVPLLNDSQGHVGPNNYQNFPVLTPNSALSSSTSTYVSGTFTEAAQPNRTLTLDFYANATGSSTTYGQGQLYLGSRTVYTDLSGNASFNADFAVGNLANDWISATATDQNGNTSEFSLDIQTTSAPSQTFAQDLAASLPQSPVGPNTMTVQADPNTISDVLNGLAGLTGPLANPVSFYLNLAPGKYSGQTVSVPSGMTLYINGSASSQLPTNLDPAQPAFTLVSGSVVVSNVTFTSTGDASAVLVTGGNLMLRNDVVQESTGFNDPAIAITGGTLDLGTAASPGGNTINVHSGGAVIQNSTSTSISAVGDSFTVNGAPLTPSSSLSGVVWQDFNNDGQVDFGETGISGVTITLTGKDFLGNPVSQSQQTDSNGAYVFLNLLPGSYTLTETPPSGYLSGIDSVGTAGGSVVASGQFSVPLGAELNGLNYNFGEQPPPGGRVQKGQSAGIGFWNNKRGQALILGLNGGSGHQLGDWLAATLPNIFGANAGSSDLAGQSNAAVAALFQQDFLQQGVKLDAQLLATALNVYVTNATLDSTNLATSYGFTVSGDGLGTATINVGSSGDAFGVANNSVLTVMDLLLGANAQAVTGVLYSGNTTRSNEANTVLSAVNQAGGAG